MMLNKIIIILISIVLLLYVIMLIDTNTLIAYAGNVFLGLIPKEETDGTQIGRYNVSYYLGRDIKNINFKLRRVLNIHNFSKGYIVVHYSILMYDYHDEIVYGTGSVFSIWKIQKINGQWFIIDIKEDP